MSVKRVGILTGGGDVPGLNSVIKSVVYRGSEIGCEVIGIRRGSLIASRRMPASHGSRQANRVSTPLTDPVRGPHRPAKSARS